MEWQAVGSITTTRDYAFTPVVTGTLFKLKHITTGNNSNLKVVIRQAFEDSGQLALFDHKLINCKVEQDIILFSLPKGLAGRRLAIKRVDNLSDNWTIEIASLEIIEGEESVPITLSDLLELQQQINAIQDALTLKAQDIDLDDHISSTNNPHNVTALQVGADVAGSAISAVLAHEATTNHPAASATAQGMMNASDKIKLDAIANGATANNTNAYLLDRKNHTGIQSIATISSLQESLDGKEAAINVLPINKGGTGSNTQNFADLITSQSIGGVKSFTSGIVNLTNASSNIVIYSIAGLNMPTTTSRSLGTKLVLYPAVSSTQVDHAIGIGAGTLWMSIPVNTTVNKFAWYAGTTEIMSLTGDGALRVSKLQISNLDAWNNLAYQNSWQDYGVPFQTPGYRKLPDGTVELRGLIKKSTTPAPSETIAVLPGNFRPTQTRVYNVISNNAVARIDILSTGVIQYQAGSNLWISLEGIRFVAEQ